MSGMREFCEVLAKFTIFVRASRCRDTDVARVFSSALIFFLYDSLTSGLCDDNDFACVICFVNVSIPFPKFAHVVCNDVKVAWNSPYAVSSGVGCLSGYIVSLSSASSASRFSSSSFACAAAASSFLLSVTWFATSW